MNTAKRWTKRLLSLLALLISAKAGFAEPDHLIAQVEQNLLPCQIIEGQPAFGLQGRMAHYGVPGVSITVIEDFEVRWVAHYGVRAAAREQQVDATTLFNVGSLSKAMASAMVLTLVEQGRVDLDADVDPQLKSWHIPDNEFTAGSPVTPLLLMNHSAGLPHRPPFSYTADRMPTTLQMINGLPPSRSTPLRVVQRPGAGFMYSNGGFTVLQILTEDVTGLDFDQAARRLVFEPLGLEHAAFTTPLPDPLLARAATGHNKRGETYADPQVWMPHTAAGGLWITAEDYARFVVELQRSVHGKSNRLFSRELAKQMVTPHASTQYGLGVFLYEGNGEEPFFSHIGDGPGFVGGFTSHRTEGFGAVVLTNGQSGINLCREVLRSVAHVYDWPGYLPPTLQELPLTSDELSRFRGRYRLGLDTFITLEDGGGHLTIRGEGIPGYRLFRVEANTFVCRERNGELIFGVGSAGRAVHVDYHLSDDIGRLAEGARRCNLMEADESTPLEKILAGREQEAEREYLAFKAEHPDHTDISESRFNRLGYRFMGRGDIDGALALFRLNTILYPESGNVFDSYGEGLLKAGRREESIAAYRRSLELNPDNANAEKVLLELENG